MPGFRKLPLLSARELTGIGSFLDQLKDSTKFNKRLGKLEEMKKEINAAILVYGKASDIDGLNSAALVKAKEAQVFSDEAKGFLNETRKKIVSDRADADVFVTELKDKARKDFSDREAALRGGENTLREAEAKNLKLSKELSKRDTDVSNELVKTKMLQDTLQNGIDLLRVAITEASQAL